MTFSSSHFIIQVLLGFVFAIATANKAIASPSTCHNTLTYPWNAISKARLLALLEPLGSVYTKDQVTHLRPDMKLVLPSGKIAKGLLPYATGLREPITKLPAALFMRAEELNVVSGLVVTDVLIGSPGKKSTLGLVRLGFLADGRPVAVKTIFKSSSEKTRNEIRSASVLSDLGIFPNLHGVWYNGHDVSIVMDISPGEVYIGPKDPSLFEIQQLMKVFTRLSSVGIFKLPDMEFSLQYMRAGNESLQLIDADGYYEKLVQSHPRLFEKIERQEIFRGEDFKARRYMERDYIGYDWSRFLSDYLVETDEASMLTALNQLKKQGGLLWRQTVEVMGMEIMLGTKRFPRSVQKFIAEN